jgi:NitT/TauT family transport system permease protein
VTILKVNQRLRFIRVGRNTFGCANYLLRCLREIGLSFNLIIDSNTVPKVALAPLLLAWFGFGLTPKIIIVVLVAFFPIIINAVVGLKSLNPQMMYLARSIGASEWQVFWSFRMANALPSIFAGLKVASVLAVIDAVVSEFVGADSGLGYAVMLATADLNIARQFSAIFILSLIGMVFFWLITYIERLVVAVVQLSA